MQRQHSLYTRIVKTGFNSFKVELYPCRNQIYIQKSIFYYIYIFSVNAHSIHIYMVENRFYSKKRTLCLHQTNQSNTLKILFTNTKKHFDENKKNNPYQSREIQKQCLAAKIFLTQRRHVCADAASDGGAQRATASVCMYIYIYVDVYIYIYIHI